MANLLGAELRHMRRNSLFLQCLAFMLGSGVLLCLFNYHVELKYQSDAAAEQLLYVLLPMVGFMCAFWVSLFLGREYDYGTIRNKLIAGYSRRITYFALSFSCMTGCVLLTGALMAGSLAVSLLCMENWMFGALENGYFILCTLLTAAVYGAIYSAITLNSPNRAVAVCICIGVMMAMLYIVSFFYNGLTEPELWMEDYVLINGRPVGDLVPNPNYVSGIQRTIYEFLFDLLPLGSNVCLNNMMFDRCERWALLSLLMLPVVSVPGYLGFGRRDLR